jgi:HSP20 family protein
MRKDETMNATLQKEPRAKLERDQREEFISPEVNIFETKDGYVLQAEMPGVTKEGLEITLEGNEITLVGRRHFENVAGDPVLRECQRFHFRRLFELDPAIDTGKISARMEQGLLTLTLPYSERVKPRKIAVTD